MGVVYPWKSGLCEKAYFLQVAERRSSLDPDPDSNIFFRTGRGQPDSL